MSDTNDVRPSSGAGLSFDNSVSVSPATRSCSRCGKAIGTTYHMLNADMVCGDCRASVERGMSEGSGMARIGRATLFGLGAALLGGGIWYGVQEAFDIQVGIIAILVGWTIGKAVNRGSRGKGGWKYQALAVLLTYFAIAATYVPYALDELRDESAAEVTGATAEGDKETEARQGDVSGDANDEVAIGSTTADAAGAAAGTTGGAIALGAIGFMAVIVFVGALPVLVAFGSPISALILGFGIFEAWKQNRRTNIELSGPFTLGAQGSAAPAA